MLKKSHLITAASAFLILGSIPWIVAESAGATKTDTTKNKTMNPQEDMSKDAVPQNENDQNNVNPTPQNQNTPQQNAVPVEDNTELKSIAEADISPEEKQELKTDKKENPSDPEEIIKLSEAFGHFIGRNLKNPGASFDLESIIKGMRDGASGKPAPMSEQEYEELMTKVQQRSFQEMAKSNLQAAENFLQNNENKPGVITLVPGKLQYEVIQEGTGDNVVKEHGIPEIHYTGKYIDGTVFGSSQDTGYPITIPLDQTVPGFSKGIIGMKEGEKRRLYIHPEMGYGTSGHLAPNALLIFDIEIIKADSPKKDVGMDDLNDEQLLPISLDADENEEHDNVEKDHAKKEQEPASGQDKTSKEKSDPSKQEDGDGEDDDGDDEEDDDDADNDDDDDEDVLIEEEVETKDKKPVSKDSSNASAKTESAPKTSKIPSENLQN